MSCMKAFEIFYLFYFAEIARVVECENHSQPISYMSTKGNPCLSVIDADSFYDDLADLLIFFIRPFRLGIIIIHPSILRGSGERDASSISAYFYFIRIFAFKLCTTTRVLFPDRYRKEILFSTDLKIELFRENSIPAVLFQTLTRSTFKL